MNQDKFIKQDETGMIISEVKLCKNKLDYYATEESKRLIELDEINDKFKIGYSSENSKKLNNNNIEILNAEYAKTKNLKSYSAYILKYINIYKTLSVNVANKSQDFTEELNLNE